MRVGDDNAVLDVESLDLAQSARVSASIREELSDDSEDRVGVNSLAWAVEFLVALAEGVDVTSVRICDTGISVRGVGTSAGVSRAHGLSGRVGRVGGESGRDGVGFPDIHLSAARTVRSETSVGVVGSWNPSLDVCLNPKSVIARLTRSHGKVPRR